MTTFFISYNRADRQWAEWIAWQLEEAGYKAFIQAWDIRPGSNFVVAMQDAAATAERTVAVLSPDYVDAQFTQPEWTAAFAQDPTGKRGLLVPVRVRDVELRGMWVALVYIDLVGLTQEEAGRALLNGITLGRAKPLVIPPFPGGTTQQPGGMTPPTTSEKPAVAKPQYPVSASTVRDPFVNWGVLDAAATEDGGLAFLFRPESTRVTGLSAVQLSAEQRGLVEKLLDQATSSYLTRDFHLALFSLVIPSHLKEALAQSTRLQLLVDEHAARYTWELLFEPSPARAEPGVALTPGLIRSLSVSWRRAIAPEATGPPSALIVADPMIDGLAGRPGARAESQAVADVLNQHGFQVRILAGASALEIVSALYHEPYRVVHIAAPAREVGGVPGLVIGKNFILGPVEFEMLRVLPDLCL